MTKNRDKLSSEQLGLLSNNKTAFWDDFRKQASEARLIDFIKYSWKILEPGREFINGWPVQAVCDHLEAVHHGQIKRLLITVPPGSMKSLSTNVFFPAWEWGPKNCPSYRYLSFAHKEDLAARDVKKCRRLITSYYYQKLWGDRVQLTSDQNTKTNYENTKTGFREVGSVGSGATGRRGDRLILDDLHSVRKAESDTIREEVLFWLTEEISSRVNDLDESVIIMIMQRVHSRDCAGFVLAQELGYEHLMIPMHYEKERTCYSIVKPSYKKMPRLNTVYYDNKKHFWTKEEPETVDGEVLRERQAYDIDPRDRERQLMWPERFSREGVNRLIKEITSIGGSYAVASQLQQRPAPRGGGLFKRPDFTIIDSLSDIGITHGVTVRGWDLAASTSSKSPYTTGAKMLKFGDSIVLLDMRRFRKLASAVQSELKATAKSDGKSVKQDIPQDPGQAGKAQKSALAGVLEGYDVSFSPESGDKEVRAIPFSAQVEAGNVYLLRATWNDVFLAEAEAFPASEYKDQIDACSRAYAALLKKRPVSVGGAPQVVEG